MENTDYVQSEIAKHGYQKQKNKVEGDGRSEGGKVRVMSVDVGWRKCGVGCSGRRKVRRVGGSQMGMRFLVELLGAECSAYAHPGRLGTRRVVGMECPGHLA